MPKLDKLPEESEARLPLYVKKWKDVVLNTDRFTKEEATKLVNQWQRLVLLSPETPIELYDDPRTAWLAVERVSGGGPLDFIWPEMDGSLGASKFAYYDFFISEGVVTLEEPLMERWKAWSDMSKLGLVYPLDEVCIVCQKPTKLHLDEDGRLHSEEGNAVEYATGWGFKSIHGVTQRNEITN